MEAFCWVTRLSGEMKPAKIATREKKTRTKSPSIALLFFLSLFQISFTLFFFLPFRDARLRSFMSGARYLVYFALMRGSTKA